MTDKMAVHEAWPARAAGLAVLGALLAVAVERLVGDRPDLDAEVGRSSAASLLAVSGLAFGFTIERLRPLWSLAFALAAGTTISLIVLWNGNPSGWSAGTEWRMVAAGLVIATAAPLFQTARDAGRFDLSPTPIQGHAWTNIILWFAAWTFAGLSFLLAQLLAELFLLIGITLLRDALREGWCNALIIGAALGGAIGLLRDRDAMLGQFQRVAVTILSVLAPVLAAGLVLFVAALPFTGLQPLWETTRATTPILLAVIGGAFILANAVLGNASEEEARGLPLRWSALALAVVMAPLATVAAISTWLRIDQYGFSPDRLWALVFVAIVLLIAVTYLWTALRARTDFGARIRPANVRLALALCAIGLLLATPLVDFGAISTRNQVARLKSGAIKPDMFDWAALRFDFGPEGRRALERLAAGAPEGLRSRAQAALAANSRWPVLARDTVVSSQSPPPPPRLRVTPAGTRIPPALAALVAGTASCGVVECRLIFDAPARAVLVSHPCPECDIRVRLYVMEAGNWREREQAAPAFAPLDPPGRSASADRHSRALAAGRVELRPVSKQQVFVDGEPVGPLFDP